MRHVKSKRHILETKFQLEARAHKRLTWHMGPLGDAVAVPFVDEAVKDGGVEHGHHL